MKAEDVQLPRLQSAPSIGPTRAPTCSADAGRPAPHARRRAEDVLRAALLRQLLLLVILPLVAAPAVTPLAAWVRWSFPAACALLAGGLFLRRRPGPYVTFWLWLFLLTQFVRRVVDGQVGYSQGN